MAKGQKPNKGHSNMIPPKKGEVRNPNGRPKGSQNVKTILNKFFNCEMEQKNPFTQEIEKMSVLELMNLKQIANALDGDLSAFKELIDRYEGKIKTSTDLTTNGESINTNPSAINIRIIENNDDE